MKMSNDLLCLRLRPLTSDNGINTSVSTGTESALQYVLLWASPIHPVNDFMFNLCCKRIIILSCILTAIMASAVFALNLDNKSSDTLTGALQEQITRQNDITRTLTLDWSSIESFYSERNYAPVWVGHSGPNTRASLLRQTIHVADEEGLDPEDYHVNAIEQLWHKQSVADLAALDVLLTDGFFRYVLDVRMGRVSPIDVDPQWHIAAPEINMVTMLRQALKAKDFEAALRQLPPSHSGYRRLRDALARYRQIAQTGDWPILTRNVTLRVDMRHAQVARLRARLIAEDSLPETKARDDQHFDQELEYAVERFQVRHGLKMDGVVGPTTRAALNVPVSERIAQIKLNMERWRWLPRTLGQRYLIVNTAAYELTAIDDEQIRFTMWVVIGKEERQTPVIGGSMHTVVFNPYWTVPIKLVFEDIIPAQLRHRHYLKSKGIRVFANLAKNIEVDPDKLDWRSFQRDSFPYVLRQDPGPDNPLGRIKFLFNNEFEIYLHDTPKRRLFDKKIRTFSAGCIRVEAPLQLAQFLLADNQHWDATAIRQAIDSGQTRDVKVVKSVPIYLLYLTSWVGPDGAVYFYRDVYARDEPLQHCVSNEEPNPQ